MFNPHIYENSRSGGFGVLQVMTPESSESVSQFIALRDTHLSGHISGPLASLTLRQTFGYSHKESKAVLEALYRFPLPGDAAVTDVSVRFGTVEIVTHLKSREEAEGEYAAAKESGQQAALVSRESPDVFTLQIAGIQPDEPVIIETTFVQLARADGLHWMLRMPLTTAPRFVREDELGSAFANGQPLALLRDPGHRFSMQLHLDAANAGTFASIESPTHELAIEQEPGGQIVQLAAESVIPDRDFVLIWQLGQLQRTASMAVYSHSHAMDEYVYFLAMLEPPIAVDDSESLPREVLLLVDHSGSMAGAKWAAADWAVERFLSDLTPDDAFALATFHSRTEWYAHGLTTAQPENVDSAVEWLKSNRDSGGTELGVALEQALRIDRLPGERARNVLIVTDAQVSDQGRLVRLVEQEAAKVDGRRMSILCIDAAPNDYLVYQLVERGGGVAKFLTSSPKETDITTALDQILSIWGKPFLVNLRLSVNRREIESAGTRLATLDDGRSALDVGDLVADQNRWIAGRTVRGDAGPLVISVQTQSGDVVASAQIDLTHPQNLSAVKALFGSRRINGLEHLLHAGHPHDELVAELQRLGYGTEAVGALPQDAIYAETQFKSAKEALRRLLVAESLAYHLPSSAASFVAVRTEAGRQVEETVAVANAFPADWSEPGMRTFGGRGADIPNFARAVSRIATPGGDVAATPIRMSMHAASTAPIAAMAQRAGSMGVGPAGPAPKEWQVIFEGQILSKNGSILLYDSTQDVQKPPAPTTITGLRAAMNPDGSDGRRLDRKIEILVFVGDPALPRAKVKLVDLLRHGERPLNLACGENDLVRIELRDPRGFFATQSDEVELAIQW